VEGLFARRGFYRRSHVGEVHPHLTLFLPFTRHLFKLHLRPLVFGDGDDGHNVVERRLGKRRRRGNLVGLSDDREFGIRTVGGAQARGKGHDNGKQGEYSHGLGCVKDRESVSVRRQWELATHTT